MSASGPAAAIARASSVSEGASATRWTTRARSRPRTPRLDRVGVLGPRRRIEQAADVVEERARGPRRRRSRRCRGGRGRASCAAAPGRRGRGSAPRPRCRGAAAGRGIRAGARRGRGRRRPRRCAGTRRPGGRRRRRGRSARPAGAAGRRSSPGAPTGPCQIRTKIAESAWASASGRGARPSSSARSASEVEIAPAALASSSAPRPRAHRRRHLADRGGEPGGARGRLAHPHHVVGELAELLLPELERGRGGHACGCAGPLRSNQSTRPGGTPEGPRR